MTTTGTIPKRAVAEFDSPTSTRWEIEDTDVFLNKATMRLRADVNRFCEEACEHVTVETLDHHQTIDFLKGEGIKVLAVSLTELIEIP
jgi:hypothetical protein